MYPETEKPFVAAEQNYHPDYQSNLSWAKNWLEVNKELPEGTVVKLSPSSKKNQLMTFMFRPRTWVGPDFANSITLQQEQYNFFNEVGSANRRYLEILPYQEKYNDFIRREYD